MKDIDYGAVFGIDEGGNEQETAEPAADTEETQGENEQEAAEPAEETQGTAQEEEQKPDDNARFAAARRKAEAERDAAVQKAREEAQAEAQRTIDEAFKNSGLTNPYTKKPITSKAEYDEYKAKFDEERKSRMQKKTGMSDEEFNQFVESLPEVQQAKAATQAAQEAARQAQEQQAKAKVDEQLRQIAEIDPSIKELKDISKMETYPQFYELVKKGNTLVDAFKLANFDALSGKQAAASRQAALNATRGKNHLSQTQTRGAGAVSVPEEVKQAYRAFNPDATDAEIQSHYNRYVAK